MKNSFILYVCNTFFILLLFISCQNGANNNDSKITFDPNKKYRCIKKSNYNSTDEIQWHEVYMFSSNNKQNKIISIII